MEQPTKAQEKEFWEGCGFYKLDMPASPWLLGELGSYDWESYKLPPIDLNSLFKWAMPKYIEIMSLEHPTWDKKGIIHHLFRSWLRYYEKGKGVLSFEDALFWALWQVKEVNNGS